MESKECTKCKEIKSISEFSKCSKYGYQHHCKKCKKIYRENRKEHYNKMNMERYYKNHEASKQKCREYYHKNKNDEQYKKSRKKWQLKYYKNGGKERIRSWVEKNKEYRAEYMKAYAKENNERLREYWKNKRREYRSDLLYKVIDNLRNRTRRAIISAGCNKNSNTSKLLGAELDIIKKHIELKFQPGMNWDNYGQWHIDHIIPLSSAKNEKELYKLCHYRNLQPLWANDNLRKGAKIIEPVQTYLPL